MCSNIIKKVTLKSHDINKFQAAVSRGLEHRYRYYRHVTVTCVSIIRNFDFNYEYPDLS